MSNRGVLRSIALVVALALLNGCFGGGAVKARPEVQLRAETALSRGIRAVQKGDQRGGDAFLQEALGLSSSIEDQPAVVVALINLARLNRLQHELVKADSYLDRALQIAEAEKLYPSETSQEKALLELAKGNPTTALIWAMTALRAENRPAHLGSRLNLVSRAQLATGQRSEAESTARSALDANRGSGQLEEEANSLRLLGMIARDAGRYDEGKRLLLEALAIDKGIGVSSKIAVDLEELATTARLSGNLPEANQFLERASVVNRAAGHVPQGAGKTSETIKPSNKP